ncbi:DUF4179 domain-containing protein [Paenibacillus prosopidis]|uniref:Uncharacterized protein DUF4179 n=1 Tax=Paenibacillus prosopidis TaxID=630520 RepID=A0A368VI90_9BACL|nr:DUF4179 domain-containing protein [Paenibacillus prosopidis]RCW40905.1 uncharacterized protein DUF4179 [Paenibacillus prosopidis]
MNRVNLETEIKQMIENYPTELPDMVRDRIDNTLTSLPTMPSKRTKGLARKMTLASAAAAILGISLIGSGFVSPAIAQALKQIPLIESVFKIAGDLGLQAAVENKLITPINQSVTLNGVTLRISEVFYDGSRLTIGIVQHSPNGIKEILEVEPVINGNGWNFSATSSDIENLTDKKTAVSLVQFMPLMPGEKLPDSFDLKLLVFLKGMEHERFVFEFPVRKSSSENRVITPMMSKTYGDMKITVQKIRLTPNTTHLVTNVIIPAGKESEAPRYTMFDNKGTMLQLLAENGSGEKMNNRVHLTSETEFIPFKTIPSSITIKPYVDESSFKVTETSAVLRDLPSPEHPIVLQQGEAGRLEITQVEKLTDKTVVHFRTFGDNPYRQAVLSIMGEEGNTRIPSDTFRIEDPEKYEFIVEFPAMKPDRKITFVTNKYPKTNYIKELEMTIPISK